ncbi:zinc finger, CCHC-type containing LTR copia-type gag-polypeptide [Tanacetum coccineum]
MPNIHSLCDSLRKLMKGTSFVSDYCRCFKAICDQLSEIGHPVVKIDKLHWFLCGFGPSYEKFSTTICATKLTPLFRDLVTQVESQKLCMLSLHGTSTPPVAFQALQHLPLSPATFPRLPGRHVVGDPHPGRHVAQDNLKGKARQGFFPG